MSTIERQISYMIHDVEPALASFQSILRLLKRGRFDPDNTLHQDLVSSCDHALWFAKDVLQNILETSHLVNGDMKFHKDWVSWDEFGEKMMGLPRILAQEEEIVFEWKPLKQGLETYTDPKLVCRILNNLSLNAIKNVPPHSLIQITIEQDKNSTVIQVLDEGPGVPEEQLNKIFDDHVQLELSASKTYKGVGLGLSFCREASALLDAKISVQNRQPHGLCVRLEIPNNNKKL